MKTAETVTETHRFSRPFGAKCAEILEFFSVLHGFFNVFRWFSCRKDSLEKISAYRKALVLKMQDELTERATKQLQAIAAFEAGMGSAMQDLVVREARCNLGPWGSRV